MLKQPVFKYTSNPPTIFNEKGYEVSQKDTILCTATISGLVYQFGDGITQWKNIETHYGLLAAIKFANIYHKPAVDYAIYDFCIENNIDDCNFKSLKHLVYIKLFSLYKNHNKIYLYYNDYKKIAFEEFEMFIKNNIKQRCNKCKLCTD